MIRIHPCICVCTMHSAPPQPCADWLVPTRIHQYISHIFVHKYNCSGFLFTEFPCTRIPGFVEPLPELANQGGWLKSGVMLHRLMTTYKGDSKQFAFAGMRCCTVWLLDAAQCMYATENCSRCIQWP